MTTSTRFHLYDRPAFGRLVLLPMVLASVIAVPTSHAFQLNSGGASNLNRAELLRNKPSVRRSATDAEDERDGTRPASVETGESLATSELSPSRRRDAPAAGLSPRDAMTALGTSPRRLFLGVSSATGIALAGNFLGVTSSLLSSLPPDVAESTGLDAYYPVGGYKRFRSAEYGYTFTIPQGWVADTSVELAKATRRAATLDYKMSRRGGGGGGVIPDAAFGPPSKFDSRGVSSNTDTNVSVVVSPARRGFTLKSLGTPTEAAETLLRISLTPEGSGRKGTLISASERGGEGGGAAAYQFEYDVDRGEKGVPLRAISIFSVREDDVLITMTVVAPKEDWERDGGVGFRRVADSFRLTR